MTCVQSVKVDNKLLGELVRAEEALTGRKMPVRDREVLRREAQAELNRMLREQQQAKAADAYQNVSKVASVETIIAEEKEVPTVNLSKNPIYKQIKELISLDKNTKAIMKLPVVIDDKLSLLDIENNEVVNGPEDLVVKEGQRILKIVRDNKLKTVREIAGVIQASTLFRKLGNEPHSESAGPRHERLKANLAKDQKAALDLFDELKTEDSEHNTVLRELLESITDPQSKVLNDFSVLINKEAERNSGIVRLTGADAELVLNVSNKSKLVNGEMSATEAYVHEIVHLSVEYARQYKKGPLADATNELLRLHNQASKEITWQQLQTEGRSKQEAEELWDYMFNDEEGLTEFIAYGLTNKTMSGLLKNMRVENKTTKAKSSNVWDTIAEAVAKVYDIVIGMFADNKRGMMADERLGWVVSEMWKLNNQTVDESKLTNMITEEADKARSAVDSTIVTAVLGTSLVVGSALDWMIEKGDGNLPSRVLGTTKNIIGSFNPWMSQRDIALRNDAWAKISDKSPLFRFLKPEGLLMSQLNYMQSDDTLATRIESLGLMNKRLDAHRENTIASVGGTIKRAIGDVNKATQVAYTEVLVDTDLHILSDKYSIKEIEDLVRDDAAIAKVIGEERAKLGELVKDKRLRNYYISQTIGLGTQLATGISDSSLQQSATDIMYLNQVPSKLLRGVRFPTDRDQIVKIIDRLATLEGLAKTDLRQREIVAEEMGKDSEGAKVIMSVHKNDIAEATAFAKKHGTMYPKKGMTKDTKASYMTVKVADNKEETVAKFKKMGYKIQEETGVSGYYMYISTTDAVEGFDKQAVAKINESRALHSMVGVLSNNSESGVVQDAAKNAMLKVIRDDANKKIEEQILTGAAPKMNGYEPIIGANGITGYSVTMNKKLYESGMRQDRGVAMLLGKMAAETQEKELAGTQNKLVMNEIINDMGNYKRGEFRQRNNRTYIEIGPDAKTNGKTAQRFSEELWEGLPSSIKKDIRKRSEGNKYIAVRRDLATEYFGMRTPTLLDTRIPFTDTTAKDFLLKHGLESVVTGQKVAGDIWKEVVSLQKVDIVLKTPGVLKDNVISNFNYSVALGQWPWTVAANQLKMFKATKRYLDAQKEANKLEVELKIKKGNVESKKRRLRELRLAMKENPVHDLMEAGMFTSVIEDINDKDLMTNSRLEDSIDANKYTRAIKDSIPSIVSSAAGTMFMTEKSGIFRVMLMATQYSDFVARANRYNFIREKGIPKKVAMKTILDEFVNYNRSDPKAIKWLNDNGLIWFSKYFFGANKSLLAKMKDRPSSMLAMSMLLDGPNPSDASFLEKDYGYAIGNPLTVGTSGIYNHIFPPSTLELFGFKLP